MPYFRYKAKDQNKLDDEGIIQAASENVAANILTDQGYTILKLEEEKPTPWERFLSLFNRVKSKDLVIFTRQLAVIISATIPLVKGLRIIVKQTENTTLKEIISEAADDVEGGAKLSSALSRHPEVFSDFFINIVRSGETSGKLDEVLNFLADQQERDYDLQTKIKGEMFYPAFILVSLFIVGILMMVKVVPELTKVVAESGVEMPLATKMLIATSDFLVSFWWTLILAAVFLVVGYNYARHTEKGRHILDNLKLKIPVLGPLFQKVVFVRFASSLNTLNAGGVPLTRSLYIVSDVVDNYVYRDIILETAKEVEDGNSVASVFTQSALVPPMVSQMLSLGEKTGRIDEILAKIAQFYSREVENGISALVKLIEPIILLIIGLAVGVMIAAIILPIYSVASGV